MVTAAATAPPPAAGDSPSERAAAGKAAREQVPRSSHGEWTPASDRPDPVDVLEGQAADRVAELVPLRYGRMLVSAFTFYRGAAAIMAADLAATPSSGLWVQACGDAHLSNIGGYASPDRGLVVDINDFDETLPGPWEWDVKRLAASFEIAGRDRGFSGARRRKIVLAVVEAYRDNMRRLAEFSNLNSGTGESTSRRSASTSRRYHQQGAQEVRPYVAKARRKDRLRALPKLTERVDGELRIRSDPPVLVPMEELGSGRSWRRPWAGSANPRGLSRDPSPRPPASAGRLPAGPRSAKGRRRWQRRDPGVDRAPARPRRERPAVPSDQGGAPSVLEPYTAPTEFAEQGQRVVEGQRLTQAASDIFLGWLTRAGAGRQEAGFLRPPALGPEGLGPGRADVAGGDDRLCADLRGDPLARPRAHRLPDRDRLLPRRREPFRRGDGGLRRRYADQNEDDFRALKRAAGDGRIAVESGPATG